MAVHPVARLHELGVRAMAEAVVKGELTPTDLAEAALQRIAAVDPRVQAWSYLDAERARREAAELTAEATADRLRGPLHGVPVGIKDEFHVQGMPTGMRGPGAPPEPEDATPVARLRAAGAIILGKLHMPVGGVMPPTRNPWNLEHTAGGSSSGSGAAVAARMVPVALGEQTGGSTLRPAAFCGVAGLKPTFGRISRYGCYPFTWSFDHPGIIGLTIEDIALVLSVVAGADPRDRASLPDPPPPAVLQKLSKPPRIGVVSNFYPERTEPVMRAAIEGAAERLGQAGANVRDLPLPEEFGLTWHVHRVIFDVEGAAFRARHAGETGRQSSVELREMAASLVPAVYYLQAQRVRRWLHERIQGVFAEVDALLMAVAPGPAPKGLHSTGDASLQSPWSCLGYPALTVSGGLSPDGLPLGLQFVGRPRQDYELCQVGAWCEAALGRLPAPPLP